MSSVIPPSSSITVVDVTPSLTPTPTPAPAPACSPLFRTGVEFLDRVLFCVGSYGITVAVVVAAFFVLLLLVRRRRR